MRGSLHGASACHVEPFSAPGRQGGVYCLPVGRLRPSRFPSISPPFLCIGRVYATVACKTVSSGRGYWPERERAAGHRRCAARLCKVAGRGRPLVLCQPRLCRASTTKDPKSAGNAKDWRPHLNKLQRFETSTTILFRVVVCLVCKGNRSEACRALHKQVSTPIDLDE